MTFSCFQTLKHLEKSEPRWSGRAQQKQRKTIKIEEKQKFLEITWRQDPPPTESKIVADVNLVGPMIVKPQPRVVQVV